MNLFRLLNIQGIAGIAMALTLAVLLIVQRGETSHWKKQSGQFEQLYRQQSSALETTIANYRAAAAEARASDQANAERVVAAQRRISERTRNDFQTRIAAARAAARRLRGPTATAAADSGGRASAPVSGLSAAPARAAETAGPDRLSLAERELATEQAIQLDELIKWVKAQHAVPVGGMSAELPGAAASHAQVDNSASGAAFRQASRGAHETGPPQRLH